LAVVLGIYRVIVGVLRYRKVAPDDTLFGDEDRADARLVVISGLVLLLAAAALYIEMEYIIPAVWRWIR
jgi:hypothetical protein